ncbi:MAG: ABC transporter ATP-binding protein [Thermoanaerobaculaceae bacterium]|nr:ABC transporter ATP-binding protein [Thermoanaerobaculaceae bacterium]
MATLIEVQNLKKDYPMGAAGVFNALKGVDIKVEKGEFVAIMGASGSGKSTLLHLLGCLDTPTSGSYLLEGTPVHTLSQDELAELRNSKIGFIFQSFYLLPRANVLENVELPLIYDKIPPSERKKRAMEVISFLQLETHAKHLPNQLSGGQRQQIAIARALVNNPSLIMADEPTGNLDSVTSQRIMELLKKLNDMGNTLILVTHEADIAVYAKRLVRIKDGIIISDEPIKKD